MLNYKNRFLLIWDIIFKPKKVDKAISDGKKEEILYWSHKIEREQFQNGIVSKGYAHEVLSVPVTDSINNLFESTQFGIATPQVGEAKYRGHKITNNYIGFLEYAVDHRDMVLDEIRNGLASKLTEDFIHLKFEDGVVKFYINTF